MRYFLPFLAYRGYIGLGYLRQDNSNLDLTSHSVYSEVGFKWILRHTFHMTLGVGVQRVLVRNLDDDSPLKERDTDPMFLQDNLDAVNTLRGLVVLRFSRAF